MLNKTVRLINNIEIPTIGFGTYKLGNEEEAIASIKNALELGYRHIDTASFYGNEEFIGKAIKDYKIKREDIFLVTKLWQDSHGYDNAIKAFYESIEKLGIDYLDLYLIHWPTKENSETWRALEDLYNEGKIKAIGVCNFKIGHLEDLKKTAKIMPMINQIEIHPGYTKKDIIEYCIKNNIQVVAWSPIMRGKLSNNDKMIYLSKKYNKSITQIILRWHIQNSIIPIPKSSNKSRMKENIDIFDFSIDFEDLKIIDSLNINESVSGVPEDSTYFKY